MDTLADEEKKPEGPTKSRRQQKEEAEKAAQIQAEVSRTRLPKGDELLGYIEQRLGGKRFYVDCSDGKRRLCRVPGRHKRRVWVREGDYVIIEPWEIQGDEKGDVVWKYRFHQIDFLKKKGLLDFV